MLRQQLGGQTLVALDILLAFPALVLALTIATFWLEVDFSSSKNSRISARNRIRSPAPTFQLVPDAIGIENIDDAVTRLDQARFAESPPTR